MGLTFAKSFSGLSLLIIISIISPITSGLSNNSMIIKTKVAVIGSTGRLGRETIDILLSKKIPIKCLIRSNTAPEFLLKKKECCDDKDLIEFVTNADVTNMSSLESLLEGCTTCLALHGATRRSKLSDMFSSSVEDTDMSHSKQVNYLSMKKLLDAARKSKTCNHIVRITGKGESPKSVFTILINMLGSMAKGWNYEGEQVLRNNQYKDEVDYTIIRPGIMKADYDPSSDNVQLQLGDNGADLKVSAVSYNQIAELCVESMLQPSYAKGTTITSMNAPITDKNPSMDIIQKIRTLKKDTRKFPFSLIEEHKRAVSSTVLKLIGIFSATLLLIIVSILK